MKFLSGIYGAVVGARNSLYDSKFFGTRKLSWPVISVGNISAGGSGKTPFVIMLGELLAEKQCWFDVLSRGYRRTTRGVLNVNANGGPEQYGDEPLLIARKLRCPVIVGEDRYAAGLAAEQDHGGASSSTVHLLDDGFQHRRLHRDFDIVLLNREDLDDRLLPIGRLREPLSSLRRADAVVVDSEFPVERLPKRNFQVWQVERRVEVPALQAPVIAFCGIARPERFFSELRKAGLDVREEIAFGDHHRYSINDVERLAQIKQRIKDSSLVTTEKDSINLGTHLETLEPVVIPMRMSLSDADARLKYMFGAIAQRRVSDLKL
jgi:tetraacyldisaccharide 4'-kinase